MARRASILDDDVRRRIADLARRWRAPVMRGDCDVEFASQEVCGKVFYPCAPSTAHWVAGIAVARAVLEARRG